MKVAIVYHFFGHYRGPVIEELLTDKKIDYYFLAGTQKNKAYKSLKLFEFASGSRFIKLNNYWFAKYFLWQKNLIAVLKEKHFDAVIFLGDWKFLSTWTAVKFLNKKKVPVMFWSHGLLNAAPTVNNRFKFSFLKLFKNGGFVYDNRAKKIMLSKNYPYPIDVIYNSLDYAAQTTLMNKILQTGFTNNVPFNFDKYVIFSGRIEERKHLEILISAIAVLNKTNIKIKALIIGGGDYLYKLKTFAADLDAEHNIIFYGSCYDENLLAKFFLKAIACVIPNAGGLTVIHSLTYGIPVIAGNNIDAHGPEIEALKNGLTGLYFKNDDHLDLAEKIECLLNLSTEQKEMYKANCLKMINNNFTPQNQHSILNKKLFSIQ